MVLWWCSRPKAVITPFGRYSTVHIMVTHSARASPELLARCWGRVEAGRLVVDAAHIRALGGSCSACAVWELRGEQAEQRVLSSVFVCIGLWRVLAEAVMPWWVRGVLRGRVRCVAASCRARCGC